MNNKWLVFGLLLCCGGVRAQHEKPDFYAAEKYDAPRLQKLTGTLTPIPFFSADGRKFTIHVEPAGGGERQVWEIDPLARTRVRVSEDAPAAAKKPIGEQAPLHFYTTDTSPDRAWQLYAEDHDLYIRREQDSVGRRLTQDGVLYASYSGIPEQDMRGPVLTNAVWSRDSRYFCLLRKDNRKVLTMSVLSSGSFGRPYLNTYKYELPGDSAVAQYALYIGSPSADSLRRIDVARWPDQELEIVGPKQPLRELFFIRRKRTRDEMELCAVNLATGAVRMIIHETSKPMINEDLFHVSILRDGADILWWSDRSGWGQYYHYDGSGRLLNPLTKGDWTAGRIVGVDTAHQWVYLYGYGKEKGVDPYDAFLYRVRFDGSRFRLLTPEIATHSVYLSPKQDYLVDEYSTIDQAPRTIVRNMAGDSIMEAFRADVKALYDYGWKAPEPFVVRAKDGVTDLYGLMWKPFDFDPSKKYPVISQVYPGPQIETVWREFTVLDRYNNTALAQLGFIVVCMGHRGNSPLRNAAYYKYGHGNLRDYALEDDKYGLEQLARRYTFMDSTRVGIFGHSGGGMMTVAAMGIYPDFYKAGVASSGNHDNMLYNRFWGESYQGFEQPYTNNETLAGHIKGPLMLVAGESDANVNPAQTMRMADALIRADKDFELLILPGQSHTYEGIYKTYYERRLRAFFARHLMGQ